MIADESVDIYVTNYDDYTRNCDVDKSQCIIEFNMGLINKVDMVCLSPVGYGV